MICHTSGQAIVAERPMYFNYGGRISDGNVELGTQAPGKTFYLAEGTTIEGFDEWICILNPGGAGAAVEITYMFPGGSTRRQTVRVAAHSRFTISVNDAVGPGKNVSARVTSDRDIVVERPMYFDYHQKWAGGSIDSGVPALSTSWCLAEGTTREGFEEWISLMNPGASPCDVTITYMFYGGGTQTQRIRMAPTSRETIDVNGAVGPGLDVSARVESSQPIIAERPMYFEYHGKWQGGDTEVGAPEPHQDWLFAEGTTRNTPNEGSFEEWISVINPGDVKAEVDLTYMFADGATQSGHRTVGPHSRDTLLVSDAVGYDKDVSVRLAADQPIIAERPMYFNYHNSIKGGDVELGCQGGGREWYFAEGTTQEGFEEWLTLMNPTDIQDTATITFMFADGTTQVKQVGLPTRSRTTVGVNRALSRAEVCDGIALHPYDYPEYWSWYYGNLVDICARSGFPDLEVVVTEIGWPHGYNELFTPEGQRQAIGEVGVGGLVRTAARRCGFLRTSIRRRPETTSMTASTIMPATRCPRGMSTRSGRTHYPITRISRGIFLAEGDAVPPGLHSTTGVPLHREPRQRGRHC